MSDQSDDTATDGGHDDAAARAELLDLLCENARYATADLARMTGLDAEAVEATIADLEASGVVQGYAAVVDWERAESVTESEHVHALVELNVSLDRETGYEDIADRLAQFPEVQALRLVSGDYDFALEVEEESMGKVSRFVSEKVAPVPEITQTVTHYVMDTYKEAGHRFEETGDDDRLSVTP
ncbi:Lrp/AsnC family transcriptional regulator [Haloglomus irregulare]|jgi:DNA-binding Lrp family transcriptional regulator|uniref:Lrp/AsnC family transcriptional regulator n=1 Tax=Haloglomus irregulare TaxID=2234134 RepID=A0A554MXG3_9EURY|nr:Lrp/AsnC family transcriptional regulator [Haloglomus irregulare]TSD09828.1 Lrp/AsnC family transcriptional regulator [Haloglomus irregulare]